MSTAKLVALNHIDPNPHRQLDRYPLVPAKVEALRTSIRSTGFWDNLLARRVGDRYQLAYGHHRVEALKQERGAGAQVWLNVRELDDTAMLKIMAHENMDEFANAPAADRAVVRAVVRAFSHDVPTGGGRASDHPRVAPSFVPVSLCKVRPRGTAIYDDRDIVRFTGWRPGRVTLALWTLAFDEMDILPESAVAEETPAAIRAISLRLRRFFDDALVLLGAEPMAKLDRILRDAKRQQLVAERIDVAKQFAAVFLNERAKGKSVERALRRAESVIDRAGQPKEVSAETVARLSLLRLKTAADRIRVELDRAASVLDAIPLDDRENLYVAANLMIAELEAFAERARPDGLRALGMQ